MELEKVTARTARRYDDACGTAHGLELVGERWALLVLRELLLGPKRFSDLKRDLPGISANVLTQRLEGLEASGLLRRRKLPPPAAVQVYELTPWGCEVEPVIIALGRFAARSPGHDPTLPLSATSLMLSFRTMFDANKADGLSARVGFRFGEETFVAAIRDGTIRNGRAELDDRLEAVVSGAVEAVAAVAYGGQPISTLHVKGDRAKAAAFLSCFTLPSKAQT